MRFTNCVILLVALMVFGGPVMADSTDVVVAQQKALMTFSLMDGSEMTGTISSETDSLYMVDLTTGFKVEIPKTRVLSVRTFKGQIVEGQLYEPDPNRSRYLWSVSAFPVGREEAYCSDFCLIFPSYNFGLSDQISAQLGAMYFPGLTFENLPIYAGLKISLPPVRAIRTAAGVQYFSIPGLFDSEDRFGMGFLFATGTAGNQFDHLSLSLGWGFVQVDGESQVMDRPIVVIAGNKRLNRTFALVTENWIIPDSEVRQIPISLALRFLGKQIAVDVGGIMALSMLEEGVLPIPIINFAYHK